MKTFFSAGGRTASGFIFLLALVVGLAACETEPDDQPPADWQAEEDRWWHTDVDTSHAFRHVESIDVMLADYEEPPAAAEGAAMDSDQFAHGVRSELLPMYRHNPEVVDSLFRAHVMGDIEAEDEFQEGELDAYRAEAYEALRDHFREPQVRTQLGQDVQISYPDTLEHQPEGRVAMQVHLNEDGVPRAVRLTESVDPTLDRIAMRAGTQMRWEPAYVMRDGDWESIESWTEFAVRFSPPR